MAVAARRVAAATFKPITLQQCRDHLRLTVADAAQDGMLNAYIAAAVEELERIIRRTLCETTWTATFDEFFPALRLPFAPLLSVESVKYYDLTGNLQTLAPSSYTVDAVSEPGYVVPAPTADGWPETQAGRINAVQVQYKAGYKASPADQAEATAAVPAPLVAYLLIRVADLFENREAISFAAQPFDIPQLRALYEPYRLIEF